YRPVWTIAVVGLRAGTGVPAARNRSTEAPNRKRDATTRAPPRGPGATPESKGRGHIQWKASPMAFEAPYMSGGRKTARLAVLCGWSLRSRGVVGHDLASGTSRQTTCLGGWRAVSSIPVHGEPTHADLRGVTRLPGGTT